MSMKEGIAYPWGDSYDAGEGRLNYSLSLTRFYFSSVPFTASNGSFTFKGASLLYFFPIVLFFRALSTSLYRKII